MNDRVTSLLLDVGVPFRRVDGSLQVEAQAYNGLCRWLDNFDSVTICAPTLPALETESSMSWLAVDELLAGGRLLVAPLPWGYDPRSHIEHARAVRKQLRLLIPKHRYLCFSNLGWLGAWGRIGAEEAFRAGRRYAVWLDWVLHAMPVPPERKPLKRLWRRVQHNMLRYTSFRDIRRSDLGLFHGKTVFDAYKDSCRNPQVVHDVHLSPRDIIPAQQLQDRLVRPSAPFRVIYVGRVHPMKGPWHWLEAMQSVCERAIEVRAEWVGDGPLLGDMRTAVIERGIAHVISFPGAEMDRDKLLARLRNADLFVFCHLTPESPRCLIEALMSGLPIIGFHSTYASDLLIGQEGGALVTQGDSSQLAEAVLRCIRDGSRRRTMSEAARTAGLAFSDVEVFRHRSDLIKKYL